MGAGSPWPNCAPKTAHTTHPRKASLIDCLQEMGKIRKDDKMTKENMEEWNLILLKACYSFKNFSKAEESHSESTCQHTSLRACHPSSQISIPTTESQQSISRYGIRERRFFCHVGLCVLMATFFWKTGKFLLFPHSSLDCLLILALIPVGGTSSCVSAFGAS